MLNAPNLVTLLRLLLAPVIALDIVHGHYTRAIYTCLAAGLTDVIDGLLARKFGGVTRIGAYFDPIADKILLSVVYIALGVAHALPWWIVAVVFGRDLLILAMSICGLLFTKVRSFPPSVWGKISTFFQIAAAMVVMGHCAAIPAPVTLALTLMVAATIWSGLHYTWRAVMVLRKANLEARSQN